MLNGEHPLIRKLAPPKTIAITATPLTIDDEDVEIRQKLGALRYLAGWSLASTQKGFGGISSMRVDDDGAVIALSDGGEVIRFAAAKAHSQASSELLPIFRHEIGTLRLNWDTESMAWDRATGTSWVGFEGHARICRYRDSFARIDRCASPPSMRDWPDNGGMESLARLQDGRFIALGEDAPGPSGIDHDMLLFAGDPVDPATPAPRRMTYVAPRGYVPTDALAIGPDGLLVLNRRMTVADGFTAVLAMVDIRTMEAGSVLRGTVVAQFAAPIPHDNFEALAMSWEKRAGTPVPILWVGSDDNHGA